MSEAENKLPFIPEEWSNAASSVSCSSLQPVIALVCGPKNSGKSTFSRNLVEVLLQRYKRVAYLDTDVGQPEFTAPGFLSLTIVDKSILESDWTVPCVKTPERCFFYGDVSSKRDPKAYLRYVYTLFDYYQLHFCKSSENKTELPLVINTPGWVKGIGYELLVDVLRYVSPSHVVKINISAYNKNLPAGLFWLDGNDDETAHLIEIQSAYQDRYNQSILIHKDARLMRDMRIIAYFRQCFKGKEVNTIKELTHELASHIPYEVPISSLTINHLHCQIPSSEVYYSLNASIVGLGISTEVFEDLPSCVGLGIVRGIDTERGILYVITPVPENLVEKVDLLLQGYIQLPTCLLEVKDYKKRTNMEKQISLLLCLLLFIFSISSSLHETEARKHNKYKPAPIMSLVPRTLYDQIFIHKDNNACPAKGFYPYEAFVEATRSFPKFGSVGNFWTRRREVAAFLAQISHETTGGWATAPDGPYAWGLCFKEEVSPQSNYCDASNKDWPCVSGKSYKGRGPIQLSWNYNYGQAGRALGFDGLQNPELVANNSVLAFKTALWFWMTEQTPKPSCHNVMVNRYRPTKADRAANRTVGYGLVTNIINGGLECGIPGDGRVTDRVGYFQRYAQLFKVTTGPNLDCENQRPFS